MNQVSQDESRRAFFQAVLVIFTLVCVLVPLQYLVPKQENGNFSDNPAFELNFSQIDPAYVSLSPWIHETRTPVAGIQLYTSSSDNIHIENGALVLQANLNESGEYTSARIYTHGILDFQYGKVVVEAMLPEGAGTWPAIWLRTEENTDTSIAIMEAQGARSNLVFANVHNVVSEDRGDNPHTGQVEVANLYTEFHEYGIEWEPDTIRFTLDGNTYHQVSREDLIPFEGRFHLVINLAMGGSWAESLSERLHLGFENGVDNSQEENWKFQIRSISYYPYVGK